MPSHVVRQNLRPDLPITLLSKHGATTAAFFVHGWRGGFPKTWNDFPQLVDDNPLYENTDCFFFQYESVNQPVVTSAQLLLHRMAEVLPKPPEDYLTTVAGGLTARLVDREYEQLVLVGHSLGGVIVRSAVLRHLRTTQGQSDHALTQLLANSSLRLFAPAQGGVQVSGWQGLLAIVGMSVARGRSRTVDELQQNSATLTQLETRTLSVLSGVSAGVAHTVWAGEENIVVSGYDFDNDPAGEVALGRSHRDVCKPDRTYQLPVDFVAGGLPVPS